MQTATPHAPRRDLPPARPARVAAAAAVLLARGLTFSRAALAALLPSAGDRVVAIVWAAATGAVYESVRGRSRRLGPQHVRGDTVSGGLDRRRGVDRVRDRDDRGCACGRESAASARRRCRGAVGEEVVLRGLVWELLARAPRRRSPQIRDVVLVGATAVLFAVARTQVSSRVEQLVVRWRECGRPGWGCPPMGS